MEAEQLPSTSGKLCTSLIHCTDLIYDFSDFGFFFTAFFIRFMFFFLIVLVNDYSSNLPAMSTPVRADGPVRRFVSPLEQIGTSSAVSDRYYY